MPSSVNRAEKNAGFFSAFILNFYTINSAIRFYSLPSSTTERVLALKLIFSSTYSKLVFS